MKKREVVVAILLALLLLAVAVGPWLAGADHWYSRDGRKADFQPQADSTFAHLDWATHSYQTGSILSYAAIALLALMTLVVPLLISSTVGTLESRVSELQFLTECSEDALAADDRKRILVFVMTDLLTVHVVYDNFKRHYNVTYWIAISLLGLAAALLLCPLKAWQMYVASTLLFFLSIALVIWTSVQILLLFRRQPPMKHLFRYGALLALSQKLKVGDANQAQDIRDWWIPRIAEIQQQPPPPQQPWQPPPIALTEAAAQDLVKLHFDP